MAAMRDEDRSASRRALIGERALLPEAAAFAPGGTVYLTAADRAGMLVSFIQSNYTFFGSGVVVPGTGIALQNRGATFRAEPEHPNAIGPSKRPYHTIIPGMLRHPDLGLAGFGVMGGYMQPQGHVQLVCNLVDRGLGPQAALDAPRFQWIEGLKVMLEHHLPLETARALVARGHDVGIDIDVGGYGFGRGQLVLRRPNGCIVGASDSRADGQAAGY